MSKITFLDDEGDWGEEDEWEWEEDEDVNVGDDEADSDSDDNIPKDAKGIPDIKIHGNILKIDRKNVDWSDEEYEDIPEPFLKSNGYPQQTATKSPVPPPPPPPPSGGPPIPPPAPPPPPGTIVSREDSNTR